jgi:Domain of unknown function (DUF4203)
MIPVTFETPAAVLLVLGGLVACFAGYRFFRTVLVLYGFVLGALMTTSLVGAGNTTQLVVAAIGGGVAGGLILYLAYFLGVALVGAAFGALVVHAIWARVGTDPYPLVVILFSMAGAATAMVLQRYVIIIATAFGGAWTLLVGALALSGESRALDAASIGNVWIVYPFSPDPEQRWLVAAWLTLGMVGTLVQLGVTGRSKPRPKKSKAKKDKAA